MIAANEEIWRPVAGYESMYEVSNLGRVKSLPRVTIRPNGVKRNLKGKMMKNSTGGMRYPCVYLTNGKKERGFLLHTLVAKAFVPNPENKPFVNHIDGNKQNAHFSNLEWVTMSENARHAFRIGLNKFTPYFGENGERSRTCKIRGVDAIMIRIMFNNGYGINELGKMFSINRTTVSHIIHNKLWKHLPSIHDEKIQLDIKSIISALTGQELTIKL